MMRTFDSRKGQKWSPPRSPDLELNQQLDELLKEPSVEALQAWRAQCHAEAEGSYFDAKPFVRAVKFGDAWSVQALLELGEVANEEAVLRCLDMCVQAAEAGRNSPTFLRRLDAWHALLDLAVKGNPALQQEALKFVCELPGILIGPGVEEGVEWGQMRFSEVFTPESRQWALPWRGPRDGDPEAYLRPDVPLSAVQLAWASGSWEACRRCLEGGMPLTLTFPASCWPAWTLKAALTGDDHWLDGLEGLPLVDAKAVVDTQRQRRPEPGLEQLHRWVRAEALAEGLPAASVSKTAPRF